MWKYKSSHVTLSSKLENGLCLASMIFIFKYLLTYRSSKEDSQYVGLSRNPALKNIPLPTKVPFKSPATLKSATVPRPLSPRLTQQQSPPVNLRYYRLFRPELQAYKPVKHPISGFPPGTSITTAVARSAWAAGFLAPWRFLAWQDFWTGASYLKLTPELARMTSPL